MKISIKLLCMIYLMMCLTSCGSKDLSSHPETPTPPFATETVPSTPQPSPISAVDILPTYTPTPTISPAPQKILGIDITDVPAFSGSAYIEINNNIPFFTSDEITDISFEDYPGLDNLGRCASVTACLGLETMPTTEREGIGMIKPAGWQIAKYDFVDGKYLYNRCHLIGFQLAGENANTRNLITGTRYMNVQGMLPIENMVANYIKDTGNHVMYRVTPLYVEDNLLCNGVLMEALSVEDAGSGINLCVFAYNVQPGVVIDYETGGNWLADDADTPEMTASPSTPNDITYILNTNTHKFHYPGCSSVSEMKEKNKKAFYGTRDEAIAQGYDPCGRCKP